MNLIAITTLIMSLIILVSILIIMFIITIIYVNNYKKHGEVKFYIADKKIEKLSRRIDINCCNHYNSRKYYLAYYSIFKIPFSVCDNCDQLVFIGNTIQGILFNMIFYFAIRILGERGLNFLITDVELTYNKNDKE